MNPLKRKDIVQMTAQELNLPEAVVEDIANFYYKYLSKKLSAIEHTGVTVANLGTFVVKRKALAKKIEAYDGYVGRLEAAHNEESSMTDYGHLIQKRKELENFKSRMTQIEDDIERKKEVTERKIAFKKQADEQDQSN